MACAGCCFIKYASPEEADRAIGALHNQYTLPGVYFPVILSMIELMLLYMLLIRGLHREWVLSKSDMLMESENVLVLHDYLVFHGSVLGLFVSEFIYWL